MAAQYKVGTFTRDTDTGPQVVTGVGFQPKALILWTNNRTVTGLGDRFYFVFGVTDGTDSVVFNAVSDDDVGTTEVHRTHEEGAIYRTISGTGTLTARATLTSLDSDGFTLNWPTNDAVASLIYYIAIGGTGVSAKVGAWVMPNGTGPVTETGVGFRPTSLLMFPCWNGTSSSSQDFLNWPSIGFCDSDRSGGAGSVAILDGEAAANNARFITSQYPHMILRSDITGGFGSIHSLGLVTSYDSGGFTVDVEERADATGNLNMYYLALRGVTTKFGVLTQPSTTGVVTEFVDGEPGLVLFQSVGSPEDATSPTDPVSEAQFCFGASDGTSQRSVYVGDLDGADPTVSARSNRDNCVIQCVTPTATGSSSTVNAEAAVSAFDLESFDLNWTTVDATARTVLYLAFLETVGDVSEIPLFVDGEVSVPITRLDFYDKTGDPHNFAEVDLNDRDGYTPAGYSPGWILQFLPITRGLSDYRGQGENLSFGAVFSDASERYWRTLLDDATNKYLSGRPLAVWMIGDEERRAEELWRLLASGYLTDYAFTTSLQFELRGNGWLEWRFQRNKRGLQGWQPVVEEDDFGSNADIDEAVINAPCPVWYGWMIATLAARPGMVPVIYTGKRDVGGTDYHEFLIGRLASKSVDTLYVDNVEVSSGSISADWLVPGTAEWTSAFGANDYRTFNGRNYTIVYGEVGATVPDAVAAGESKLTINMEGVEDVGDSTGDTLTAITDQLLHFLTYWVARPDTSTDEVPYPVASDYTFPHIPSLPFIDEASFVTAKADLQARLNSSPADYQGAAGVGADGERISVQDVIARFCVSGDFDWYYNRKGQFAISVEPVEEVDGAEPLSDVLSIIEDSFSIQDDYSTLFFNVLPWQASRDYTDRFNQEGWWRTGSVESATSIANFDQRRDTPPFELWHARWGNSDYLSIRETLLDNVFRKLCRYRQPLRKVTLETSLGGLQYEVGDVIPVTHVEGPGASGWVGRKVRVIRHEVSPTEGRVRMECYDLAPIWEANSAGSPS
jgi:hypothetical protein